MNNIYDNGKMLLGTKKDILEYQMYLSKLEIIDEEDYKEITETLEDLKDNTIVCMNYDNGMGITFDWWNEEDKVKGYKE